MRIDMVPEMSLSLSLYAGDNETDSMSAAWSEAQMTVSYIKMPVEYWFALAYPQGIIQWGVYQYG